MRGLPTMGVVLVLVGGCALEPISYEGKRCPEGVCPANLSCEAGLCVRPRDGGARDAGANQGFLVATLGTTADDANWLKNHEEPVPLDGQLYVSNVDEALFGARFALDLPPGATITHAYFEVTRFGGTSAAETRFDLQLWDSVAVPPFDATHEHPAELHAGTFLATRGTFTSTWVPPSRSSDLAPLLQQLVSRADWHAGAVVGLVVSAPDTETTWATFYDSSYREDGGVTRAQLSVEFRW